MDSQSNSIFVCTNCYAVVKGRYCSECGQRRFNRKSLTVIHFLKEAFHLFTHFDFKIFTAVKYLITRPGFLTWEFSQGKLNQYIKPFTLFLLLNLFFFFIGHKLFFIKDADYNYYVNIYPAYKERFAHFMLTHHLSEKDVAVKFNFIKEAYQKLSYFWIIPLFALVLQLIFFNRKKLFVEHLIQAIHCFCWYMLLMIVVIPLFVAFTEWFHHRNRFFELYLGGVLFLIVLFYNYFSIRRIYNFRQRQAIAYAVPISVLMIWLDSTLNGWLIFRLVFWLNFS